MLTSGPPDIIKSAIYGGKSSTPRRPGKVDGKTPQLTLSPRHPGSKALGPEAGLYIGAPVGSKQADQHVV
jgi:hypothetical protein